MEVTTNSKEETQKIASEFAKTLKPGDIVALFGELGAGKTAFVSSVAKALGIKRNITSPTFIFAKTYTIGDLIFHHLDLYRANDIKELEALDLDGLFSSEAIVMIEWADRIQKHLPKKRIDITITKTDENKRRISITRN